MGRLVDARHAADGRRRRCLDPHDAAVVRGELVGVAVPQQRSQVHAHDHSVTEHGDGEALAYEIGVPLQDIEFVQFYPTAMGKFASRILLYEAFISQPGARILNAENEDVLKKHGLDDPRRATRDLLARAIMSEIRDGLDVEGGLIMDLSLLPESRASRLKALLPSTWERGTS